MADALRGGLIINEVLPDPGTGATGYDTDRSGTVNPTDEYIEFYNSSSAPISLAGIQLWDPGNANWFTFPAGSVLGAGSYAVVVTRITPGSTGPAVAPGSLVFNANRTAILNNGGDVIFAVDPSAQTYIAAGYGGVGLFDPTNPATYPPGFPATGLATFPRNVTRVGAGEHFGPNVIGDAIQRTPNGADVFVNNAGPTPGSQNICFGAGTRIATPDGGRRVEALRPGDLVSRADGGRATVRWVGHRLIELADLLATPKQWPIQIAPGALGSGAPHRALVVSPQHRVLVRGRIVERLFGAAEVLVAARHLVGIDGITCPRPVAPVTYVHILCERHEVVLAEGAPCETLFLGPMARATLAVDAVAAIDKLMPGQIVMAPARPILTGREARELIARHMRHGRPLLAVAALRA